MKEPIFPNMEATVYYSTIIGKCEVNTYIPCFQCTCTCINKAQCMITKSSADRKQQGYNKEII